MSTPPPLRGQYRSGSNKRTLYIVLALVAAGVVLGGLLLVGIVIYLISSTETTDATAEDLAVVVTAGDLVPHFEGLVVDPGYEYGSRISLFDGSVDIDYDYDHPDPTWPLKLQSSASIEVSERDARESFSILVIGVQAGFALAGGKGVTKREDNDFFAAGDKSRHFHLLKDGDGIGHMLFVRSRDRILSFTVIGASFDDGATLGSVVRPKLAALSSYDTDAQERDRK